MPRKPGDAKVSLTQEQKNALIEADDFMYALDGTGIERYTPAELKTIQADLYQKLLVLFPGPQEQRLVTWVHNVRRPNGERLPPWLKSHRLARPPAVPKQAPPPCRRPAGPTDSLESGASRRRARMALLAQQQRQAQMDRMAKDQQKADIASTAAQVLVAPARVTEQPPAAAVSSPPPVLPLLGGAAPPPPSATSVAASVTAPEDASLPTEESVKAFVQRLGIDSSVPLADSLASLERGPTQRGPFPFMLMITDVDADPRYAALLASVPAEEAEPVAAAPMEVTS